MARVARILAQRLDIASGERVVKARDYARIVAAEGVLADAERQARDSAARSVQAFEEEKVRGYQTGLQNADQLRLEQAFETVAHTIRYFQRMEGDLISLLETALDKIAEGLNKDQFVRQVITRALRDYRSLPHITLHLSRDQEQSITEDVERLILEARLKGIVEVSYNARLQSGSCSVESPLGTIELGLESQIEALKAVLGKLRASSSQPSKSRSESKS